LATYQDSTANGSVTISRSTGSLTYPVILQFKGSQALRYALQKSQGTDAYVTDGVTACFIRATTGPQRAGFVVLYPQRIDHIPAFSLLAQYANSNLNVQYGGTGIVNGQTADVITWSFAVSSPPTGFDATAITQHTFYVDQTTGWVTKMQFHHFDDHDRKTTVLTEMYFSRYQFVNGIWRMPVSS
jgi:hypothetical protein